MIGYLFDFNGTMVYDLEFHNETWKKFALELWNRTLSQHELLNIIQGNNNLTILKYFTDSKLSAEEYDRLSHKKESYYQQLSREKGLRLIKGLPELLDKLKADGCPMNMASSSIDYNIKFYFENYNLHRWFDIDKIIYDDGVTLQKPFPDMYIKAAENISLTPKECTIFEDSAIGVESALRAGAGKIIRLREFFEKSGSNDINIDIKEAVEKYDPQSQIDITVISDFTPLI